MIEASPATPSPASLMTLVIGVVAPCGHPFLMLSLNLCQGKGFLSFGFVLPEAIDSGNEFALSTQSFCDSILWSPKPLVATPALGSQGECACVQPLELCCLTASPSPLHKQGTSETSPSHPKLLSCLSCFICKSEDSP